MRKAKILRLHFPEKNRYNGKPLYEAIVQKCYDMNIAGATVFRGHEGFGESAEIHKHHLGTRDQPVVVVIAESADRISVLVPILEKMMDTGMMAISDVETIRVERDVAQ